jgi:hypothetical protein
MWAHYADDHRGICLEFDLRNEVLCGALRCEYLREFPLMKAYESSEEANLLILLAKGDAWAYHWKTGGPTSVSMMIAVAQDFVPHTGRDDKALEHAARTLAQKLSGPIREPAIDQGREDFNRLDQNGRIDAAMRASQFAQHLQHARQHPVGQEAQAIAFVTSQFGKRVPARVELVRPDQADDSIRSTPARQVAAPLVPTTRAG